jgi:AhpC/TSA family
MNKLPLLALALLSLWVVPAGLSQASGRYNPSEPTSHPKTKGLPPTAGQSAPAIALTDTTGRQFSLSAYRGKTIVLEWVNFECPYVDRHYSSGTMQETQRAAMAQNVVWLTVFSSAVGKQGYQDARGADYFTAQKNSAPTAKVLDPSGAVGRAFGARTTPHMFVISPAGRIVYAGAIDDVPRARVPAGVSPRNYVLAALEAMRAGRSPNPSATTAYGCSIKY